MDKRDAKFCYYDRQFVCSFDRIGYEYVLVYTNSAKKLLTHDGYLNKDYKRGFNSIRKELKDKGFSDRYIDILIKQLNKEREVR